MGGDMSKSTYRRIRQDPDWENEYREACKKDSDVKNFHDNLETDMDRFMNAVKNDSAEGGLSMDSLKQVTSCLAKNDEYLKNLILKNEKDVWRNSKLCELIDHYYKLNGVTYDFYTGLVNWLKRLEGKLLLLESAFLCIKYADPANCMEKFAQFKKDWNLFNEELSQLLTSVCAQHEEILKKLEEKRKKSGRKLKSVRMWRKLSNIICAAAFMTVVIFSVVAAAMTAPPLVVAILAAPSLPIGSMGEWMNQRSIKCEKKIKVECDVIDTMQKRTDGGLFELKRIKESVDRLDNIIGLILERVHFFCEDKYNQQVAMDDVMEKLKTSKVQMGELKNAVEYIREKRESPEDQNAVEDDIRKKEQIFKQQINAQKVATEKIKKQQESFKLQIDAQNVEVDDFKKQHEIFKKQISRLCSHLEIRIQEIKNNEFQVFSKKSGIPASPVVVKFDYKKQF